MKLKELCEQVGIEYNSKRSDRILKEIKKTYLIEQNGNKKDYKIVRKLSDEELNLSRTAKHFNVSPSNKYKSGVYRIVDDINKKVYIGQTINFYRRFVSHIDKSNKSTSKYIIESGNYLFEVLELESDLTKRLEKEKMWIERYQNSEYTVVNIKDVKHKYKNNKTKNIKVSSENYEVALKLLKENNLI